MAPSEPGARLVPSDRTIALASSIVMSKPDAISIREYLLMLRQHIAKGRRSDALSSSHRHLDRSSHWRSEYERMKDANEAAEKNLADLKVENEKLKQGLEKSRSTSPVKKRKNQPDEDVILVPRSPKKQKKAGASSSFGLDAVELATSIDLNEVEEIGSVLIRKSCDIRSQIKSHKALDPSVLAHRLANAASAIPGMVQKIIAEHDASDAIDPQQLKSVLNAADRSVRLLLLTGIQRLSNARDSDDCTGHVTYAYVQMFNNLLECLDAAAALEVSKSEMTNSASPTKSKASPIKGKAKQPKQTNIKDNDTLNLITKLLCSVIDALDSKVELHKSLFEGFAYVVLKRLGSTLYLLIFGHARGATIEEEIEAYNEEDEIEDTANGLPTSSKADLLKPAKLEAPYLIHLLTRIMNAAPSHLDAAVLTKSGSPKKAVKGSMKGALTINARERLQRTLIQCMFGEEEGKDDEFHDCLKMPAMKDIVLPTPKVKEPEVQEWFKDEIWRLLGWEILSREIEA